MLTLNSPKPHTPKIGSGALPRILRVNLKTVFRGCRFLPPFWDPFLGPLLDPSINVYLRTVGLELPRSSGWGRPWLPNRSKPGTWWIREARRVPFDPPNPKQTGSRARARVSIQTPLLWCPLGEQLGPHHPWFSLRTVGVGPRWRQTRPHF